MRVIFGKVGKAENKLGWTGDWLHIDYLTPKPTSPSHIYNPLALIFSHSFSFIFLHLFSADLANLVANRSRFVPGRNLGMIPIPPTRWAPTIVGKWKYNL